MVGPVRTRDDPVQHSLIRDGGWNIKFAEIKGRIYSQDWQITAVFTRETPIATFEPYAITVNLLEGCLSTIQFEIGPLQRLRDVFSIDIFVRSIVQYLFDVSTPSSLTMRPS